MEAWGQHSDRVDLIGNAAQRWRRLLAICLTRCLADLRQCCRAAETINAYSIWPENWARPMLQEFEAATGIKVNFLRFSSGEALARVIAEKNNPQGRRAVRRTGRDLRRRHQGGRVRALQAAAQLAVLPARFKAGRRPLDRDRRRSAGLHDQPASS